MEGSSRVQIPITVTQISAYANYSPEDIFHNFIGSLMKALHTVPVQVPQSANSS